MAFGTKYRCEFTDILGLDWKIDIQKDPDPGSITTLQASGNPMTIEWYGEDNIFDQNIMGSMMTLSIETDTDFTLSDLFTSNNLEYKVIVYQGVTVFWNGYILANNYMEPYDKTPFSVSITATDGFGILKDFKFIDLAYTTRQITSVVIHDIIDLVGITVFTEYVNLYESTMSSGVGDSPLDQSGVDPDLFKEMNCYEALETILKSFSAGIKQDQGIFTIYRYVELKDTSMKGRIFTTGTAKSSTTKAPLQYLNRPTQASNFWDYEGGAMIMVPHIKRININHDFKARESWWLNYNFPYADFTAGTGWTIPYWSLSTDTLIQPTSVSLESADDKGVWMLDASSAYEHWIYQELAVKVTTSNVLAEFEVAGWAGNDAGSIEVELHSTDGVNTKKYGYSLTTGSGSWVDTTLPIYTVLVSKTWNTNIAYETVKIPVAGIPYTGTLTIKLYNSISAGSDVNAIYKTIKFYTIDSNGQFPKGIAYVVANTVDGQVIDREYILGDGAGFDNDHLQYAGALNVWSAGNPIPTSRSWHTRGATENKPLIEVIGNELGNQFARHKHLIDLPLREMHDDEFLMLTGNLQDVLNQTGGNNRVFAIASGVFNVKDREWDLVLNEII